MQLLNQNWSLVFFCVCLSACTTLDSIQAEGADYVIPFEGVDSAEVFDCVLDTFNKDRRFHHNTIDHTEYKLIESSSKSQTPIAELGGVKEGRVPYFATRFYRDRVEIFGRTSIGGKWAKIPLSPVKDCIASLGGTIIPNDTTPENNLDNYAPS